MKIPLFAALFTLFLLTNPMVQAQTPPVTTAKTQLPNLSLSDIVSMTPAAALRQAIAAGDLRFLGVNGYGLTVPGVPDAIVRRKGRYGIEGTSDSHQEGNGQDEGQEIAGRFAMQYNRLLLAHLKAVNDTDYQNVVGKIDEELQRMERDNPLADAAVANKKGDSSVIGIQGIGFPGLVKDANYIDWEFGVRVLKVSDDLMTPAQKIRLKKAVTRYVIPYNQAIQKQWNASRKKKNGTKGGPSSVEEGDGRK